jgi:hypothetical protein
MVEAPADKIVETSTQHDVTSKQNQQKFEDRMRRAELWNILLTAAIAFFALCSIGVGLFQWHVMDGQLREMRSGGRDTGEIAKAAKALADQAKAQTDTMKDSLAKTDSLITQATDQATATNNLAVQAKRAANIAQRSLEESERPWVGVTGVTFKDNVEIGKILNATAVIQNSGNSPAIHVVSIFSIQTMCQLPQHPQPDISTVSGNTSVVSIMPHASVETGECKADTALTEDVMALYRKTDCNIYAFARITYNDIMGRSHWRHFCAAWNKDTPKGVIGCSAYNDGDEDYPDGKEPN